MPITFNTAWKDNILNALLGKASYANALRYMQFYNGAQPANPTTAPAGSPVYSSAVASLDFNTGMSVPEIGVSSLSNPTSKVAANTVSAITFARLYDAAGVACVDVPVSLSGGGGSVIVPMVSSQVGVPFVVDQFSVRMPRSVGTVRLNIALANLIASWGAGDKLVSSLPSVFSSASILVYSGTAPATADEAATGSLLVTFTTASAGASWDAPSGGVAALTSGLTAAGSGTGTATYARIVKGSYVLQCSVGTTGTDLILDTVSITPGPTITLSNATITL